MYSAKSDKDKFYTKESVAIQCISLLQSSPYDCVVEPSAGNGVFSNNINHHDIIALDIEPDHPSILQQDWFDFVLSQQYNNILVIGNPPFGKRNALSKAFINKAISLNAQTIAFILPDVYNKHTLQSIFPKEYRLIKKFKLPTNSFTIDGEDFNLPCTFFIWDKSEGVDLRYDVNQYKTDDFTFVNKSLADSNCFFILGASPNTVTECSDVVSTNRGYYIKPQLKCKKELVTLFKAIKFNGQSSASGNVAWLTKTEIIKNYLESFHNTLD